MNYTQRISTQLNLRPAQVAAAIELLDAGNTLPFVARYRKEMTGNLDEEQLRQLVTLLTRLRALDERRQTVVASIEAQGKLTPKLHQQLLAAETRTALEDLYQPYKPKRRTRASAARDKGLQGLADLILGQERTAQTVAQIAAPFITPDVPTVEDALAGARDIVAETISDHPDVRRLTREKALKWGMLRSEKTDKGKDERGVYQLYYDFEWQVNRLRPHQVLAINRGEAEKVLRVRIDIAERDWLTAINSTFRPDWNSPLADQLTLAADDAAQLGNGTASRETEKLAAELIRTLGQAQGLPLRYIIVSEAGASVYSASPLARAELPDMDVSMRGAVSIARRVQDPLAELVKIDPQSIGVGMYQHDVNQAQLTEALANVVESVANSVGVDVNTASPALLTHVAGIGPKLAARIVAHRDANGPFPSRMALKSVPGLGPKTFEQAWTTCGQGCD